MDRLSSCYFCGDALDASLDEYPVVPASIAPDPGDRQSIVLCQPCKRKLDPVIEAVVDAVDAADGPVEFAHEPGDNGGSVSTGPGTSGSDPDPDTGRETSGAESADSTGDDTASGDDASAGTGDIGSTLGDDDDVLRPVGGEDGDQDGDGVEEAETGGMEFGRSAGDSGSSEDGETGTQTETGNADPSGSSDNDGSTGDRKYTSGQRAGGRPTDPDDGEDDEDEADDERDPDVTMTRLENTNVMRLLRNREFPVERDDFVTVASSAYEISPRKCEKVIQLAIKHDLIREDGGQLFAGDNWG